jgi:hypothetical protein
VLSHLPGLRNGDTSLQQSARVPAIGLDLALRLKKLNLPRKTSRYGFCLTPERQLPRYSVSAVAAVEQMAPSVPSMKADMMAKTGALLLVAAVVGLALAAGWLYRDHLFAISAGDAGAGQGRPPSLVETVEVERARH